MNKAKIIIDALNKTVQNIENQDRTAASKALAAIQQDVDELESLSKNEELNAAQQEQILSAKLSGLIVQQTQIYNEIRTNDLALSDLRSQVTSHVVSIANNQKALQESRVQQINLEKQLAAANRRIADLHDTSVGAIFRSIFSLGLDRAVMAIAIEVDGIKERITNYKTTINRYQQEINNLNNLLNKEKADIQNISNVIKSKNNKIVELKKTEDILHHQEEDIRKKIVFFTKVNAFYIKIQNLLSNVEYRLDDVKDIVELLDDKTPTIHSFDPSNQDVLTLNQAIILFGNKFSGLKKAA